MISMSKLAIMVANMCRCVVFVFPLIITCTIGKILEDAKEFEVEYSWNYVNFTWNSVEDYNNAILNKNYITVNTAIAGIKFYKDKVYLAMPRIRPGAPVTLGSISKSGPKTDPLITPFPNWELNDISSCDNLQNVQSMEIDSNGIMWVIDGLRQNDYSHCPTKLILFDLNDNDRIVHQYIFPENICLSNGGFLNDIVVDGNFSYITDASGIDPGLIIYSWEEDHSWKIRDGSMFPEGGARNFAVDGIVVSGLTPIDGIALSPASQEKPQKVYYCALTGLHLYAISTDILKDEQECLQGNWRTRVQLVGQKQAQSDGMVIDNLGNLYYGLLPLYGVGTWDIHDSFTEAKIVYENNSTMIWTDSFAFDDSGYLYLLANNIHKFFDVTFDLENFKGVKIRILKLYTGTNSYLH